MSMPMAIGLAGSPGIRIIWPATGITKPAPEAISTSRMFISNPYGATTTL